MCFSTYPAIARLVNSLFVLGDITVYTGYISRALARLDLSLLR